MKKIFKILFILVFVFIVFSKGNAVEANSIQSISMDIFINENGDARVTETWNCHVTEGTEVYHPYHNLGNSEIKDLTVTDGNTKYTTLSKWKTSGTLSNKAQKCGINKISDGIELCWGISEYGSHTYIAQYTITNFVSETQDAQMIYWTLIPHNFSTSIGKVYIKIHSNFRFADTFDVWGYGNYGGTAYVYDGYIEMQSNGNLAIDEYMTILVKFPLGTFNTTNQLDNDFVYYYDMAEQGANSYIYDDSESYSYEFGIVFGLFFAMIILNIWLFAGISISSSNDSTTKFQYGPEGKKIPKDVPYFRDIPCQKDIFRAYYIAYRYDLIATKTDLLGAIILKWLKDGIIRIEEKETGILFKKENTVIVLKETNPEIFEEKKEKELFKMLYSASHDGYLESKEFEKWCKHSYSKILSWFDEIIKSEENKLIEKGLIKVEDKTKSKMFKNKIYKATSELKKEALELSGLKRYLNEYTLIKEREAMQVHLFEEYLIFAQIMGIAKKVAKEFQYIYPEIIEQSNYISYNHIMYIEMSSNRGISAARTADRIAKSRASGYSSGGGGFSSGGGGGGSFGGGSFGGGGFR